MASSVSAFGLPVSSRASRSAFSLATTTSLRPLGGGEVGGENGGENGGVVAPCLVNVIAVDASSGIPASSNIASFGGTNGPWLRRWIALLMVVYLFCVLIDAIELVSGRWAKARERPIKNRQLCPLLTPSARL